MSEAEKRLQQELMVLATSITTYPKDDEGLFGVVKDLRRYLDRYALSEVSAEYLRNKGVLAVLVKMYDGPTPSDSRQDAMACLSVILRASNLQTKPCVVDKNIEKVLLDGFSNSLCRLDAAAAIQYISTESTEHRTRFQKSHLGDVIIDLAARLERDVDFKPLVEMAVAMYQPELQQEVFGIAERPEKTWTMTFIHAALWIIHQKCKKKEMDLSATTLRKLLPVVNYALLNGKLDDEDVGGMACSVLRHVFASDVAADAKKVVEAGLIPHILCLVSSKEVVPVRRALTCLALAARFDCVWQILDSMDVLGKLQGLLGDHELRGLACRALDSCLTSGGVNARRRITSDSVDNVLNLFRNPRDEADRDYSTFVLMKVIKDERYPDAARAVMRHFCQRLPQAGSNGEVSTLMVQLERALDAVPETGLETGEVIESLQEVLQKYRSPSDWNIRHHAHELLSRIRGSLEHPE